jgi:hypothetical protein
VRKQVISGPGIVEWALPLADIGTVRVRVRVGEADLDPDDARRTWCPACASATTMRAAMTPDGRRFDVCDDCGLLWHVDRRDRSDDRAVPEVVGWCRRGRQLSAHALRA